MTKKALAKAIAEEMGLTQGQARAIIQRVFTGITETLLHEGRLELRNFGVFEVKQRRPRRARNPRTGQAVAVPAKLVVTFRPGRGVEERVGRVTKVPGGGAVGSAAPEGFAGRGTGQRPGLRPTCSPFWMTTMRGDVARWVVSPRLATCSAVEAGRPITMKRLPLLVGFMAVPVRARANERSRRSVRMAMWPVKGPLAH